MIGETLLSPYPEGAESDRISGVAVAFVKSNKLDAIGRIEITLPGFSDDVVLLARVATLMAGPDRGTLFLPEKDDEVLVAFECGDITRPYVIGALWNGKDQPPDPNSDGKNNLRLIKSRSGHIVRLDDTDGSEKIEIIDKGGKNKLTFDTKNDTIKIESAKDISVEAPQGKITLKAKSVEITSSEDTKVDATGKIDVTASSTLTLKGSTININ